MKLKQTKKKEIDYEKIYKECVDGFINFAQTKTNLTKEEIDILNHNLNLLPEIDPELSEIKD